MLCPQCGVPVGEISRLCDACQAAQPKQSAVSSHSPAADFPDPSFDSSCEDSIVGDALPNREKQRVNIIQDIVHRALSAPGPFFVSMGLVFCLALLYFSLIFPSGELLSPIGCAMLAVAGAAMACKWYAPKAVFDSEFVTRTARRLGTAGIVAVVLGVIF